MRGCRVATDPTSGEQMSIGLGRVKDALVAADDCIGRHMNYDYDCGYETLVGPPSNPPHTHGNDQSSLKFEPAESTMQHAAPANGPVRRLAGPCFASIMAGHQT